jgi:hypothetical protein
MSEPFRPRGPKPGDLKKEEPAATAPPATEQSPDAPQQLTMVELRAYLSQAQLSEADFTEPWELQANIYRSLLWNLANRFANDQGWTTEMTHCEYSGNPDTGEAAAIDLCLSFSAPNIRAELADESFQQGYEEFAEYLNTHANVIPPELRQQFTIYIGFNYGNNGAVEITPQEIRVIPQNEYDLATDENVAPLRYGKRGAMGATLDKIAVFEDALNEQLDRLLQSE